MHTLHVVEYIHAALDVYIVTINGSGINVHYLNFAKVALYSAKVTNYLCDRCVLRLLSEAQEFKRSIVYIGIQLSKQII